MYPNTAQISKTVADSQQSLFTLTPATKIPATFGKNGTIKANKTAMAPIASFSK